MKTRIYVNSRTYPLPQPLLIVACAAALALCLCPRASHAGNLLVNPSFEASSGHVTWPTTTPAVGWTYFSPPEPSTYFGDYWVESQVPAHASTFRWRSAFHHLRRHRLC